jgi:hypothetical protein
MLVILISTTWFSALLVVVALCRIAAHGDRSPQAHTGRSPRLFGEDASAENQALPRTRTISLRLEDRRSKAATAEHVGDGAQEDLYVRP